jgi:hypothetical protein
VRLRDVAGERDEQADGVLRARPITFRRTPRSIRSAVSFVAERITIAS